MKFLNFLRFDRGPHRRTADKAAPDIGWSPLCDHVFVLTGRECRLEFGHPGPHSAEVSA